MPYHLTARPPASDAEARQVHKLAHSHHAQSIDPSLMVGIHALTDGLKNIYNYIRLHAYDSDV
jgi:hypothetical protein